jgi:hypothetical protein
LQFANFQWPISNFLPTRHHFASVSPQGRAGAICYF